MLSASTASVFAVVVPTTTLVSKYPFLNPLEDVPMSIALSTLGVNVVLNSASWKITFALVPLPASQPNITFGFAFAPVPKFITSATFIVSPLTVDNVNAVSDGNVAVPDTTKLEQTIPPIPILC